MNKIATIEMADDGKKVIVVSFNYSKKLVETVKAIEARKRYLGLMKQWVFLDEYDFDYVFDELEKLGFKTQRTLVDPDDRDPELIHNVAERNRQKRKRLAISIIGTKFEILPESMIPLIEKAYELKCLGEWKNPFGWRFTDHKTYVGILDEMQMAQLIRYAYRGAYEEPDRMLSEDDAIGRAGSTIRRNAHFMSSTVVRINWLTAKDLEEVSK